MGVRVGPLLLGSPVTREMHRIHGWRELPPNGFQRPAVRLGSGRRRGGRKSPSAEGYGFERSRLAHAVAAKAVLLAARACGQEGFEPSAVDTHLSREGSHHRRGEARRGHGRQEVRFSPDSEFRFFPDSELRFSPDKETRFSPDSELRISPDSEVRFSPEYIRIEVTAKPAAHKPAPRARGRAEPHRGVGSKGASILPGFRGSILPGCASALIALTACLEARAVACSRALESVRASAVVAYKASASTASYSSRSCEGYGWG